MGFVIGQVLAEQQGAVRGADDVIPRVWILFDGQGPGQFQHALAQREVQQIRMDCVVSGTGIDHRAAAIRRSAGDYNALRRLIQSEAGELCAYGVDGTDAG